MDENKLLQTIKSYEEEYKRFMGVEEFPLYETRIQTISIEEMEEKGCDSAAEAKYEVSNNKHTLIINSNLLDDFLVFHEFTHILDSHQFVKENKVIYMGITGFSEYHASQVELVKLLGSKTIDNVPNFSMNTLIAPFSVSKTVSKYVEEKQQLAIDLFGEKGFPNDFESLKKAIGVLYNYWGLRSICEMYARDYKEDIKNNIFLNHISALWFCKANNLMHGWLDNKKALASMVPYQNIFAELFSQCKHK